MKLAELISIFRAEADDTAQPFLWSDVDAIEFANDAENEACRRARLITDASTAAICERAVAANAVMVSLDPRVIFVRRAKLDSQSMPLALVDHRDLDMQNPRWELQAGTPRAIVRNWESGKLRLYPMPSAADTLRLRVVRTPLVPMANAASNGDSPEIAPRYHRSLVYWMLYRAFSRKDTQTQDDRRAAEYLALFENEFGKKSSAIDETYINENYQEDSFDGVF
ncbi:MAG: DUF6682 family protein [Casimicrobium sp.]